MLAAALLFCSALATNSPPPGGEEIIRSIHAAHSKEWFRTMTFVQKTTFPGRPIEYWYETMEYPGKLRLDVSKPDGTIGTTQMFRNDSLYAIVNGVKRSGRPYVHSMLVLIVDLHVANPDTVIAKLRGKGYDLSKTHDDTWLGKKVTVVGAAAGDSTSAQFWVDMDRKVVVRMVEPTAAGGRMDAHIGKHLKTDKSLIEREILIHTGNKLSQIEEYIWVKTDAKLESGLFDPDKFVLPAWIAEYQKANGLPK